jgi:dihydroneopterin aldolase
VKIEIKDLEFNAIIGLLDFERDRAQKVRLHITIEYDYIPPNYLDYAQIVEISRQHIRKQKYELLEDALAGLDQMLKEQFPIIDTLHIAISKPNILPDCEVIVSE